MTMILMVIPMREELEPFVQECVEQGLAAEPLPIGRVQAVCLPGLGLVAAKGGLGKVQFGVQTQHLMDRGPEWEARNSPTEGDSAKGLVP